MGSTLEGLLGLAGVSVVKSEEIDMAPLRGAAYYTLSMKKFCIGRDVLPDLLSVEPGSEHVLWAATCEAGTRCWSVVSCGPRSRVPGIGGGLGRSGMVAGGGGDGDGDDGDSDGGRMPWKGKRRWGRRRWWVQKDSAVVPAQRY